MFRSVLTAIIVVFAGIDALIHLSLDIFFFHGQFFGGLLNVLFLLNFGGYVVLTLSFVVTDSLFTKFHRVVSLALLAYAGATILAWLGDGQNDLLGLGYVSKAAELTLILTIAVHLWTLRGERPQPGFAAVHRRAVSINTH